MAFLRQEDYKTQTRKEILSTIVNDDTTILTEMELAAQAEIESYLRHRYDVSKIFVNLSVYDASATYATGDLILFPDVEDDIYSANEDALTGTSPVDDPSKWTKGDTRDQLIRMHMIDLTLYHLHSRINPRNIPTFRISRRDECISWLKMVARGEISTGLPTLLDDDGVEDGLTIVYGRTKKAQLY